MHGASHDSYSTPARVTAAAARCQQRIADHSELIAQTDAEADGVRAETKVLAAQWRDSLAQLRAADAAMQVCALCLIVHFLHEQHRRPTCCIRGTCSNEVLKWYQTGLCSGTETPTTFCQTMHLRRGRGMSGFALAVPCQVAEGRLAKRQDDLRAAHAERAGIRRDTAAAAAAEHTQATKKLLAATETLLTEKLEATQTATAAALVRKRFQCCEESMRPVLRSRCSVWLSKKRTLAMHPALPAQEQAAARQTDVRGLEAELAAAQAAGRKLAAEQAELEAAQAAADQDIKV
jgi:hypothetical protein